jgi:hypothetical protein
MGKCPGELISAKSASQPICRRLRSRPFRVRTVVAGLVGAGGAGVADAGDGVLGEAVVATKKMRHDRYLYMAISPWCCLVLPGRDITPKAPVRSA